MLMMMFEKEKEKLSAIINSKNVLQNLIYKLTHDLNSKDFFDNVVESVRNYDSLERMKAYDFRNDVKEMREVLHYLYRALQSDYYIKDKSSQELAKCCNVFPDHVGEKTIILLSYIPIIDLFEENLKYEEYFKNEVDLEREFMGQTYQEKQQSDLFKKTIFSKTFPEDEKFIDYELRNKYVKHLKEEYQDSRKEEIQDAIALLLSHYDNAQDKKQNLIAIGSAYWDEKQQIKSAQMQKFASAIESISKSLTENEQSK